ncbi:MAG: GT-D fold domain-containing protein, partial [Lachnospiraceae bacterium]|nr:GT-D fold domain-containing protein [Lachnospiraceae bacterium]
MQDEKIHKKVILWAAGANARKMVSCLRENVLVSAVIDNDALRWGELFCGAPIIPAADIWKYEYNYVVITTPDYEDILCQLGNMAIDSGKIITPFAPDRCKRDTWREIFHVGELLYYVLELRITKMSHILENAPYEISAGIENEHIKRPVIRSIDETLEKLREGYSMSRYGDGELNMILDRNFSTFQVPDRLLILKLREILQSTQSKHMVCIPDIYGDFYNRNQEFKSWFRRHLADGGREYDYSIFDMDKVYYNAFITRPYID